MYVLQSTDWIGWRSSMLGHMLKHVNMKVIILQAFYKITVRATRTATLHSTYLE